MRSRTLIFAMCAGQLGSLLPHVVVPAVMPAHLIPLWGLSGSQAGLLAASYATGYMLAVPVLASLTDRIDARTPLLIGSLFSGAATLAFGWLADGLASALVLWLLAGIGFAGVYMPGLRALTDRLPPGEASRSVTLYTSSFSLGVGLSFLVSQLAADRLGWRWAFLITGLGPLLMAGVALSLPRKQPPRRSGALLDFKPVLRNRPAMGYILGYAAHCFELYGMRSWIVAFWTFVTLRNGAAAPLNPIIVSVLVTVLAMPASILGNECAIRFGRHRAITAIQLVSAIVAVAIGLSASGPPWLLLVLVLLYAVTVPADSGSLTAGTSASADARYRGATLALHSTAGFGFSALAGWAVGVALDAFGGPDSANGWLAGFGVLAAGVALGPVALWWSRRQASDPAARVVQ